MALTLQNFQTMVANAAAACQAASSKLLNLAVGSTTRAIIEGSASIGLWIQYLIVRIWLSQRLATSQGADVDTFVGDYGLSRLSATAATGSVTFSRFYAGVTALIVPYFTATGAINTAGAQVLTADLTMQFGVQTDTTNALWNAPMGGYLVPIGTLSVTLPVQALIPGTAGNVQAGAISLISAALPGIDTVTNGTQFSDGEDAESDAALKARFTAFVATRAEATLSAVEYAVASVQAGLSYAVIENMLPNGTAQPGFFTVTVDDGSGSPSTSLLSTVYSAVDKVRPVGSSFTVQAPAVIYASVNLTITVASGFTASGVQAKVVSAITSYINSLGIGQKLYYTRLSAIAYGVQGVSTVTNMLLNSGVGDIGGGPTQVVKATGASVVVNTQ